MKAKIHSTLFLTLTLLCYSQTQVIITTTTTKSHTGWTTGNENHLQLSGQDETLYGLTPSEWTQPMVIPPYINDFVRKLDSYIDKCILDLANIDPKDFRPEQAAFQVAYGKRLDPFIHTAKLWLAIVFGLYFIRLQYGGGGGFKMKVERLRARNIEKVGKTRNCSLFIIIVFGTLFILLTVAATTMDFHNIIEKSDEQSETIRNLVSKIKETMYNINNGKIVGQFYKEPLSWPNFNIVDDLLNYSGLDVNLDRPTGGSCKKQIGQYLRWYPVICLFWWVQCIVMILVHKHVFRKRYVSVSLFVAFMYALMIVFGLILIGYKFSFISLKSEMCIQTLNTTMYERAPIKGNGISQFILAISSPNTLNWVKSQLYLYVLAANSAYTIYLNRLAALGRQKEIITIQSGNKIKTLFDLFISKSEKDKVLITYYNLMSDIWSLMNDLRILTKNPGMKTWAYQVSNNVCYTSQIIDLISVLFLVMVVVGLFCAFFMAVSSEYVLRCIIYEEKASIDMNKFRFDWS